VHRVRVNDVVLVFFFLNDVVLVFFFLGTNIVRDGLICLNQSGYYKHDCVNQVWPSKIKLIRLL